LSIETCLKECFNRGMRVGRIDDCADNTVGRIGNKVLLSCGRFHRSSNVTGGLILSADPYLAEAQMAGVYSCD
jgi:hypothetical protein